MFVMCQMNEYAILLVFPFSTRKIRGALNFDDADVGLVSDSMVANSLYLQNGSCASSSGAPIKTEQPES